MAREVVVLAYPGGVLWVLQHPLCATASVGLVRKTCYTILTVASSYSETARSNRTIEASAPEYAQGCGLSHTAY